MGQVTLLAALWLRFCLSMQERGFDPWSGSSDPHMSQSSSPKNQNINRMNIATNSTDFKTGHIKKKFFLKSFGKKKNSMGQAVHICGLIWPQATWLCIWGARICHSLTVPGGCFPPFLRFKVIYLPSHFDHSRRPNFLIYKMQIIT